MKSKKNNKSSTKYTVSRISQVHKAVEVETLHVLYPAKPRAAH